MKNLFEVKKNPVKIPGDGVSPTLFHIFDDHSIWAINAAMACRRPLLVRGVPGTGKTQLAMAAAHVLNRPLIKEVITATTENIDLHWRFDSVARLAQAQLLSVFAKKDGNESAALEKLDERRFLTPGPLWWAFNWQSAVKQNGLAVTKYPQPRIPEGWKPKDGAVLLLDELDKSDGDVPNGLLESLGNGMFSPPYIKENVVMDPRWEPLLTIITTNEETQLPAAFIRRCLVLELKLPEDDSDLVVWLVERGQAHFSGFKKPVLEEAAKQLVLDRNVCKANGSLLPGQAEYLDILRAIQSIIKVNKMDPLEVLKQVKGFSLQKSPASV